MEQNLENLNHDELKKVATELGLTTTFRSSKQLRAAITIALAEKTMAPASAETTTETAAEIAAVVVTEAAAEVVKVHYRITPKNGVGVTLGGRYHVPAEGVTVEEGHPLVAAFDYHVDSKRV